jgi:Rrf2 family protein
VNVTLSKRGSYAAAAAICLARAYGSGRPKKLREISAEMAIPRTFASQILGDLVHAGIAVSAFGRDGGHRLARPPELVSVAEVIEAAEGPLASERCALRDGPCRWHDVCPLHETMTKATASLRSVLASTTLAMLAERDAAIADGTYPVPADSHRQTAEVAVTDSVQIELSVTAIAARLSAAPAWLTAVATACDQEEPQADGLPKTVAVHLGQPAEADGAQLIPLVWEAAGAGGLFPRLQGELELAGLDPDRSELRVRGKYRPATGTNGHLASDALRRRTARAAVRGFLRRIASHLEDEHRHGHAATYGAPPAPAADSGVSADIS